MWQILPLSGMLLQDVRVLVFIPFHQYGLIYHKFRLDVNNLFYKYEKLNAW